MFWGFWVFLSSSSVVVAVTNIHIFPQNRCEVVLLHYTIKKSLSTEMTDKFHFSLHIFNQLPLLSSLYYNTRILNVQQISFYFILSASFLSFLSPIPHSWQFLKQKFLLDLLFRESFLLPLSPFTRLVQGLHLQSSCHLPASSGVQGFLCFTIVAKLYLLFFSAHSSSLLASTSRLPLFLPPRMSTSGLNLSDSGLMMFTSSLPWRMGKGNPLRL